MAFRNRLYNITPISNVPSIMSNGILSFRKAKATHHFTFAMRTVQERRDATQIPNGLNLHDYACLYFDPRNATMYSRKAHAELLCVLVVSARVLAIPDVVISDRNAATPMARYLSPEQLGELNFDRIYATNWNHPDREEKDQHKKEKCAEVLVPHSIGYEYVLGAYVVNEAAKKALLEAGFPEDRIRIDPHYFFQ